MSRVAAATHAWEIVTPPYRPRQALDEHAPDVYMRCAECGLRTTERALNMVQRTCEDWRRLREGPA